MLPVLLLAGCEVGLQVGRAPQSPDGATSVLEVGALHAVPPDAYLPAADAGVSVDAGPIGEARTFDLAGAPMAFCADALGGREPDFAPVGASDVGLESGPVRYDLTPVAIVLQGPLFERPFRSERLVLQKNVFPDQPPGTFVATVPIPEGPSGPLQTQVSFAAIYVDTTVQPPRGEAGFQFDTATQDGACFLSFPFLLTTP